MFTMEDDLPLEEAFKAIYEHEDGKASISHKASDAEIAERMEAIIPTYDKEQVRPADMKKLFKWYNLLIEKKAWTPADIDSEDEVSEVEVEEVKEEKKEKKKAAASKKPKADAAKKPKAKKKED